MSDTIPPTVRWSPDQSPPIQGWARPGAIVAMLRGFAGRCPCCGEARLFAGWLRQVAACPRCAAPLGRVRADDAPPYVVIFVVGHLVIATLFALDDVMGLPIWAEMAIFLPLTLAASLALLRPVKGALIGLMLQLGMVAGPDA